jgi:ribosomal protein S11/outer membrane murein-binding lipoprotein Lpp
VLDAAAVLDFPESAVWSDYVVQFNQPAPPVLLDEIASEVNEAYTAEMPLDQLLKKHRLLALARASLSARILVLRELSAADPSNPVWSDDLGDYERARHRELGRELEGAMKARDLEKVAQLDDELSSPQWSVAAPQKVVTRARRAHQTLRRENARKELVELAQKLNDAFSDFDVPKAQKHRQRWDALSSIAALETDHELLDMVGPALDWLDEEAEKLKQDNEYQHAIDALQLALDKESAAEEYERLYHAATRFGRELPQVLEQRLAERMRQLQDRANRKRRMIVAGVVASVLIVASATTFFIMSHAKSQEIARHVQQLQSLIKSATETGVSTDADDYLKSLAQATPEIALSPEIMGLREELGKVKRDEEERKTQIQALLSSAEEMGVRQARWESFDTAFADIETAQVLAQTAAERAGIKKLETKIRSAQVGMQTEIDKVFQTDFSAVQEAIQNRSSEDPQSFDGLIAQADELKQRKHVSERLKTPLDGLMAKLRTEQSSLTRNLRTAKSLQFVTNSVGDIKQFQTALKQYADANAGTTRAGDFTRILAAEVPLWKSVDDWNSIRGRWKSPKLTRIASSAAKRLLTEYESFEAAKTAYAGSTRLTAKVRALEFVAKRDETVESIEQLLGGRIIDNVFAIETLKAKTYYTDELPRFVDGVADINCFTSDLASQKFKRRFKLSEIKDSEKRTRLEWLSPQSRFAKKVRDSLATLHTTPWEEKFKELITTLVADRTIDPVYKAQLLNQLLFLAARGSAFLSDEVKPLQVAIRNGNIPRVNWVDPDSAKGASARVSAKLFFKISGESFGKAFDKAILARAAVEESPVGPAMKWVGWIHRAASTNSEWTCSTQPSIVKTGFLSVFILKAGKPALESVGSLYDGKPVLDSKITELDPHQLLVEGRPIFLAVSDVSKTRSVSQSGQSDAVLVTEARDPKTGE